MLGCGESRKEMNQIQTVIMGKQVWGDRKGLFEGWQASWHSEDTTKPAREWRASGKGDRAEQLGWGAEGRGQPGGGGRQAGAGRGRQGLFSCDSFETPDGYALEAHSITLEGLLSEGVTPNQSQMDKCTAWFYFYEVSRGVRLIETASTMVAARGWREEAMES